jgi:hypothetical protein
LNGGLDRAVPRRLEAVEGMKSRRRTVRRHAMAAGGEDDHQQPCCHVFGPSVSTRTFGTGSANHPERRAVVTLRRSKCNTAAWFLVNARC